MVRKMFRSVRKGVAMDFLNKRGSFFSAGLYHPDPVDLYRFCSRLSKRVVLRCDYKPTEFCIYMYRDTREAPGNVYRDSREARAGPGDRNHARRKGRISGRESKSI
jgi:hypothetical protein